MNTGEGSPLEEKWSHGPLWEFGVREKCSAYAPSFSIFYAKNTKLKWAVWGIFLGENENNVLGQPS